MKLQKVLKVFFLVIVGFLLFCDDPIPVEKLAQARFAIHKAKQTGADIYAKSDLQEARKSLIDAHRLIFSKQMVEESLGSISRSNDYAGIAYRKTVEKSFHESKYLIDKNLIQSKRYCLSKYNKKLFNKVKILKKQINDEKDILKKIDYYKMLNHKLIFFLSNKSNWLKEIKKDEKILLRFVSNNQNKIDKSYFIDNENTKNKLMQMILQFSKESIMVDSLNEKTFYLKRNLSKKYIKFCIIENKFKTLKENILASNKQAQLKYTNYLLDKVKDSIKNLSKKTTRLEKNEYEFFKQNDFHKRLLSKKNEYIRQIKSEIEDFKKNINLIKKTFSKINIFYLNKQYGFVRNYSKNLYIVSNKQNQYLKNKITFFSKKLREYKSQLKVLIKLEKKKIAEEKERQQELIKLKKEQERLLSKNGKKDIVKIRKINSKILILKQKTDKKNISNNKTDKVYFHKNYEIWVYYRYKKIRLTKFTLLKIRKFLNKFDYKKEGTIRLNIFSGKYERKKFGLKIAYKRLIKIKYYLLKMGYSNKQIFFQNHSFEKLLFKTKKYNKLNRRLELILGNR